MKRQTSYDLTIVIPAYREDRRIGATLDELARFLTSDPFWCRHTVEVLIVAADAPDKTHAVARSKRPLFDSKRLSFRVLLPGPRVGKGRDVQYGMLRARGRAVIFMDADLATPLHHLEDCYAAYVKGADVVIGTRNLLTYRTSVLKNRFAWFGNRLYRLAGGVPVEDTQCGFKLFSQAAAMLCFTRLTILGWGFDQEILAVAQANRLTIQTHRIDDWDDKPGSTYTESPIRITLRSVHDFTHITINRIRGSYRASS